MSVKLKLESAKLNKVFSSIKSKSFGITHGEAGDVGTDEQAIAYAIRDVLSPKSILYGMPVKVVGKNTDPIRHYILLDGEVYNEAGDKETATFKISVERIK